MNQPITDRIRPRRTITGMSAILLPFAPDGSVDWVGFEAHVLRTLDAGLVPAINMDTGFVQIIDAETRATALTIASTACAGRRFVGGVYVADQRNDSFNLAAYQTEAARVAEHGGVPIMFPSWGLHGLDDSGWVDAHEQIGADLDAFLGFELGSMFVPNGRILGLDAYRAMLDITSCIGAKHSSLSRVAEWDRLALRDEVRPDFLVLTGNDLAIDMVMWGSDYLLGLSTFAPDAFALRDRLWQAGDPTFHELNDLLQELGSFVFRPPVPGYRHNAAMFLHARGWIDSDAVPPGATLRPESDRAVVVNIAERLDGWLR